MANESPDRVSYLCTLARERIIAGDYDGARSYLHVARDACDSAPPPELLRLLADLTAQLQSFAEGVQLMAHALDGFRLAEDHDNEVGTAADLAALLQRAGDLGRARAMIEWAVAHMDGIDAVQRARILNIAATVATFQGQLDEAYQLLRTAQSFATGRVASWIALNIATALSNLGRHEEAWKAICQAESTMPCDHYYTSLMLNFARTWCMLMRGDIVEAYDLCRKALPRMARHQHPIVYYPTIATLGVLAREVGDLADSAAFLSEALSPLQARSDQATAIGIYWHMAMLAKIQEDESATGNYVRTALHAMRLGGYGMTILWQPNRVAQLCAWAIERGVEVAYASWLLQTSLASWAIQDDGGSSADTYTSVTGNISKLYDAGLTPRECEVLTLAAQGLSDKEIAERLVLSLKTIQSHLYRCYTKLGVHGRGAAIQWLQQV